MPCTPIAESASRTSSSLNGLMMAVTSFMSEGLLEVGGDSGRAELRAGGVGIDRLLRGGHPRAGDVGAERPRLRQRVARPQLPVLVREAAVVRMRDTRRGGIARAVP